MPSNDEQKNIHSVSAHLEGKPYGDRITRFEVQYYPVEAAYAQDLLVEEDYRQTRVIDLKERQMPRTSLKELTDSMVQGGLSLVSTEPVPVGAWLVMDLEVPTMVQRVRLLGEVVPGRHGDGIARDETAASHRSGIDIVAINRTDLRRAENQAISRSMKENR